MDNGLFISDLIERLKYLKEKYGDLELSTWDGEIFEDVNDHIWVDDRDEDEKFLIIE